MRTHSVNLRIGEKINLSIVRLGINGEGIGYFKRRLIFVPYALPDEEILAEIVENQQNFSRAKIVKIGEKSPYRVEPEDKVYHELSSSHIMHLAYPQQLLFKQDLLRQALEKYRPRGWQSYELLPTIGMTNPRHYRNKLQYQLRRLKNGRVIAGLYKENSHHLLSREDCLVQERETQKIANRVCELLERYHLPIEDERQTRGLRTVMIRRSQATGEVQMIFVSSSPIVLDGQVWPHQAADGKARSTFADLSRLLSALTEEFSDIVTVAVNYHPRKTSDIYGEVTQIIFNEKETITEEVLDYSFELSPRAFYQLNAQQANVLYQEALRALAPKKEDRVIDAYCGVGTIGFAFAGLVKSVHGMDTTLEAIQDAKANAARLGFKNCHYEVGPAEKIIPSWYKAGHRPTALVVDPPRTGLGQALLATITKFPTPKMVYVSCNVSTLAKDLVQLAELYRVDYIQSVDMFPHTARTEAVVKLTRKK
jgi:23S rRNA (uracil-5-)-methyltransferase RumA